MADPQLAIVAAILLRVRDMNPPHGVMERFDVAAARAIEQAKQLIKMAEQS